MIRQWQSDYYAPRINPPRLQPDPRNLSCVARRTLPGTRQEWL